MICDSLTCTHLGFIYLDLFKFRDGPFLHYEGMDQFDFEGGLLSMCFKDLYVWGLGIILRRLLSYEKPSFASIGYSHQQLSRAPFGSGNRQSQFHCPKSKIWKVWILLDYKYIIKMKFATIYYWFVVANPFHHFPKIPSYLTHPWPRWGFPSEGDDGEEEGECCNQEACRQGKCLRIP